MAQEQLKPQLPVQIRLLKVDEVDLLLKLQEESIRTLNARDYNQAEVEALVKSQVFPPRVGRIPFVAEYEGQLVGFVTLDVAGEIIDAIFVHPDFERCGIGRQLMAVMEQEALQRRIKRLLVFSSLTAVDFYRSLGYSDVRKLEISCDSVKIPCISMFKQLIPVTLPEQLYEIVTLILKLLIMLPSILFHALFK